MNKTTGPKAGERWFRPASNNGFVVKKSAETRHVVDRTYGGDVIYISGRRTRFAYKSQCTLALWLDWALDARRVKP